MFDDICTRILSPPKFKYSMYDLGSAMTKNGKRTDFIIYNLKNHKMNCSLYQPHTVRHDRTCVVYLHSMNGSRLQGLMYSQLLLQQGISYCTFDFSGCGNSDGQKISFGASQKYDIQIVIKKLKQTFYLNRFILWGRSMGAVAAIKYAQLCYQKSKISLSYQKQQILAMILDSPFKSLSQLLIQIGHTQTQIPRFLIKAGYYLIKNALEQNGQFKIQQLDLINPNISQINLSSQQQQKYPLTKIKYLQLPILFLASKEDKTVPCQHSIDMFNNYDCIKKDIAYFRGLHNQSRQEDYLERVFDFVRRVVNGYGRDDRGEGFVDMTNGINQRKKSFEYFGTNPEPKQQISINRKMSTNSFTSYPSNNININNTNLNTNNNLNTNLNTNNNHNTNLNTNNNHNTNLNPNTIPDPLTLQHPPTKPTLIQLIQQRFFKSTQNDSTQTLIQAQSIQSSCVCTMFDNNNIQQTARDKYLSNKNTSIKQNNYQIENQNVKRLEQTKNKDILLKNYNWSKYTQNNNNNNNINNNNNNKINNNNNNKINNQKPNFNCDRISLKQQQKINKIIKNQSQPQSQYQSIKQIYYGPMYNNNNRQKPIGEYYHTQKIITSKSIDNNKTIGRAIHLPQIMSYDELLMNNRQYVLSPKQNNHIFNQLYKPLRTASQKDLKGAVYHGLKN